MAIHQKKKKKTTHHNVIEQGENKLCSQKPYTTEFYQHTSVALKTKGRFVPQLFIGIGTVRSQHCPTVSTCHCQKPLALERYMSKDYPLRPLQPL